MSFNSLRSSLAKLHRLGTWVYVKRIVWPKEYSNKTQLWDIALLETKRKIPLSSTIRPACLPKADYVEEYQGPLMVSF